MITSIVHSCRHWFSRNTDKLSTVGRALVLGAALTAAMPTAKAMAAERLHFTYGPLGRSIAIEDLRNLADTGETTRQIRWYLRLANLEAEELQRALNQEVPLSPRLLNRFAYTLPAEYALFETGQILHSKSRQGETQILALRSTLVLSATDDGKISIIEFLEKYPIPDLYVDGVILARVARNVGDFVAEIRPAINAVKEFLGSLICDCEAPNSRSESYRSE